MTEWRIQKRVDEQFTAFITGFHELIPADLINVFDERELELLIGGISDIDVDDWIKNTDYRGYEEKDPVIQNFWKVCHYCRIHIEPYADESLAHPKLGFGTEITSLAVRYWHVAYPC